MEEIHAVTADGGPGVKVCAAITNVLKGFMRWNIQNQRLADPENYYAVHSSDNP